MECSLAQLQMRIVCLMEYLCLVNYMLLFIVFNLGAIPTFLAMLFSPLCGIPLFYMLWYFYDYQTPFRGGRRVDWIRNLFIWKYVASYFPIRLHKTADLDPKKNYIFGYHPHGILGMSSFINFQSDVNGFSKLFPGIFMHVLTLDVNFRIPFYREYALAIGLGAVRQDSISYKLTKLGPGHSVMIVTGGAAEAQMADPENPYRLKIKSRKGFVREALKAGAGLVPVFSFGESQIYHQAKPKPGTLLFTFQKWTHKIMRFVPILFYGNGPFPLRTPVNSVVGSALDLPHLSSPTAEEIDHWHGKYIESVQKLFDSNKARFGVPGKELELY